MLRKHENLPRIHIKPELPKKSSIQELYNIVTDQIGTSDMIIWIVDFDTILAESNNTPAGKAKVTGQFIEMLGKLAKEKSVEVIINNPCLEFWFLLHFVDTKKSFPNCNASQAELKKHVADYAKSKKYYVKPHNDIYERLRPHLPDAVERSRAFPQLSPNNISSSRSDMYKLFVALRIPLK